MPKINIAILHGIGKNEIGYADDLIKGIEKEFKAYLKEISGRPDDGAPKLNFRPIVWDDILGGNQGKLKVILERQSKQRKRKTFVGLLTALGLVPILGLFLFSQMIFRYPWVTAGLLLIAVYVCYRFGFKSYHFLRTTVASEFVMDIIGYLNKDAKAMIQQRIKDELKIIDGDKGTVTFIAHSLGTVIASDFIYDRQEEKDFGNFQLGNFFTMGSPIALFALRWGADAFNKPIRVDNPNGCWINILDKDDPIAYPLKDLNKEYNDVVLADKEINVGPVGVSHVMYWKNEEVHKTIARKLAEDWMRMNGRKD